MNAYDFCINIQSYFYIVSCIINIKDFLFLLCCFDIFEISAFKVFLCHCKNTWEKLLSFHYASHWSTHETILFCEKVKWKFSFEFVSSSKVEGNICICIFPVFYSLKFSSRHRHFVGFLVEFVESNLGLISRKRSINALDYVLCMLMSSEESSRENSWRIKNCLDLLIQCLTIFIRTLTFNLIQFYAFVCVPYCNF